MCVLPYRFAGDLPPKTKEKIGDYSTKGDEEKLENLFRKPIKEY